MQAKPATDEEWLPKQRAAKLLGASTRQLERRTAAGYIEKKLGERKPTERNPPVFYSKTDILAFKAGKPNVHAREVTEAEISQEGPTLVSTEIARRPASAAPAKTHDSDFERFARLFAAAVQSAPVAAPKPWLTPAEAAEYSGLPVAFLIGAARAGTLRAVNVGTGAREFWRFNREGLSR